MHCKSFSHFFNKNFSVFGYKVVKHLTSWPLNELTMLWTSGPRLLLRSRLIGSTEFTIWSPSLGAESRKKSYAKHFGYKLATGLHLKNIRFWAIPRGLPTGNSWFIWCAVYQKISTVLFHFGICKLTLHMSYGYYGAKNSCNVFCCDWINDFRHD